MKYIKNCSLKKYLKPFMTKGSNIFVYKVEIFKSKSYLKSIFNDLINLCLKNPYYKILILGVDINNLKIKNYKDTIIEQDEILFNNGSIIKVMPAIYESRADRYNYLLINEKFLKDKKLNSHVLSKMETYEMKITIDNLRNIYVT